MVMKPKKIFLLFLLVVTSVNLHAEVRLTNLFTDNMILQRDQPVKIWATNQILSGGINQKISLFQK